MAVPAPTIDLLLNLIDTRPQSILSSLAQHPHLASARDAHGYSLVHAAASYNQLPVLRELIQKYNADVNLLDEDGETALFATEHVDVAKCLVEELSADVTIRNAEGKTAEEKIGEEEGEANEVYQYLRTSRTGGEPVGSDANGVPSPPNGLQVNMDTMTEDNIGDAPDPEIRRRIDELAAREDFQTEAVQAELRALVQEVITGMSAEQEDDRNVRRRVD